MWNTTRLQKAGFITDTIEHNIESFVNQPNTQTSEDKLQMLLHTWKNTTTDDFIFKENYETIITKVFSTACNLPCIRVQIVPTESIRIHKFKAVLVKPNYDKASHDMMVDLLSEYIKTELHTFIGTECILAKRQMYLYELVPIIEKDSKYIHFSLGYAV